MIFGGLAPIFFLAAAGGAIAQETSCAAPCPCRGRTRRRSSPANRRGAPRWPRRCRRKLLAKVKNTQQRRRQGEFHDQFAASKVLAWAVTAPGSAAGDILEIGPQTARGPRASWRAPQGSDCRRHLVGKPAPPIPRSPTGKIPRGRGVSEGAAVAVATHACVEHQRVSISIAARPAATRVRHVASSREGVSAGTSGRCPRSALARRAVTGFSTSMVARSPGGPSGHYSPALLSRRVGRPGRHRLQDAHDARIRPRPPGRVGFLPTKKRLPRTQWGGMLIKHYRLGSRAHAASTKPPLTPLVAAAPVRAGRRDVPTWGNPRPEIERRCGECGGRGWVAARG